MLPDRIALRVMDSKSETLQIMEQCDDVTVMVLDIVGFTSASSRHSPKDLTDFLNALFSELDQLCDHFGLEKVCRSECRLMIR